MPKRETIVNVDELKTHPKMSIIKVAASLMNTDLRNDSSISIKCPFHHHDDPEKESSACVLFYKPGQDGMNTWKCMSCGSSGTIYDFARKYVEKHEKRPISFTEAVQLCARLSGIPDDEIQIIKEAYTDGPDENAEKALSRALLTCKAVLECNDTETRRHCLNAIAPTKITLDESIKENVIQFIERDLYYDSLHESVVIAERFPNGELKSFRHQKRFFYDAEKREFTKTRSPAKWSNLKGCEVTKVFESVIEDSIEPILVVEGVRDRIVCQLLDLEYINLNSARVRLEETTTQSFREKLFDREIFFLKDFDAAGEASYTDNIEFFNQCQVKKLNEISWKDMCKTPPTKGYDLSDFIRDEVEDAIEAVAILTDINSHIEILSCERLGVQNAVVSGPLRTEDEFLDTFILRKFLPLKKKTVSMLAGPGGIGKSFFICRMCIEAALNDDKKVLYLSSEEEVDELNERMKIELRNVMKVPETELEDAYHKISRNVRLAGLGTKIGHFVTADGQKAESEIEKLAAISKSADLIIIDPFISFFAGNENESSSVRIFFDMLSAFASKEQKTLLVVHHTSKDGKAYRGSSAIEQACRLLLRYDQFMVPAGEVNLSLEGAEARELIADTALRPFRYIRREKDNVGFTKACRDVALKHKLCISRHTPSECLTYQVFEDNRSALELEEADKRQTESVTSSQPLKNAEIRTRKNYVPPTTCRL